jgi:hypothetical protein
MLDEVDAQTEAVAGSAAGASLSAGRANSLENGGVSYGLAGTGVTSLPTQLLSLEDANADPGARIVSQDGQSFGNSAGSNTEQQRGTLIVSRVVRKIALKPTADLSVPHGCEEPEELSRPVSADLIASLLPFDRATLENAVDRLFEQLDVLNAQDLARPYPRPYVISLAVASTLAALELARRYWRRRSIAGVGLPIGRVASANQIGFPELPGSWSSRCS